jgi:DNA-binding LacI/PurR family transcriptional regulator
LGDVLALGALKAIQDLGLEPGRDVAVTGFDDSPTAGVVSPSLTSIRQPVEVVAATAIDALLRSIKGDAAVVTQDLIAPELV